MRVVLKEMKKILTIKNVLLLLASSILVMYFMGINESYRIGDSPEYYDDYSYTLELYKELISRAGSSLTADEVKLLDEIEEEQYKILDAEVEKYDALKELGITTYKELEETAELFYLVYKTDSDIDIDEDEITKINICRGYYVRIGIAGYGNEIFDISEESVRAKKWLIEIGMLRRELPFNWSEEELNDRLSMVNVNVVEAFRELYTSGEYSLLYDRVESNSFNDLAIISIWIVTCCLFLVLPYQVREKQSRTKELKFSSKAGRNLYVKQWLAVQGSCIIVALINLLMYTVCFFFAGYGAFISCPNTTTYYLYWVEMSFGMHLLVYALLIMIFTISVGTIFFLLSEVSSYVEAIAMGVPCGILLIVIASALFDRLFAKGISSYFKPDIKLIEVLVIGVITLMIMYIFSIFVRKNLRMDVEER